MLKNKTIVITGASSGIGKACAEEFAKQGANLVIGSRKYDILCSIKDNLESRFDTKVVAVQCDVSKEEECDGLIRQAILAFKRIDVLVNNAGVSMRALFEDAELFVLKHLMDVNFWGMVYCTKYAFPELIKTKGTVIGVSSIAGYHGVPGRTGYSASKFAMNGFLESLRIENLKTGLHVLTVAPGFTISNIRYSSLTKNGTIQGDTSMNEVKMMSAQEVAEKMITAIVYRKRTLVLTSLGKNVLFLKKIYPSFLDKVAYKLFSKESNPLIG